MSAGRAQEVNGEVVPRQFRYKVTPHAKINVFKPKPLTEEMLDCRPSQLGAAIQDLKQICGSAASIVWEV